MVQVIEMAKRKADTVRIDERVLDAIKRAAQQQNTSKSHYIETLLIRHCQSIGLLPLDFQPLGETRGGNRYGNTEED